MPTQAFDDLWSILDDGSGSISIPQLVWLLRNLAPPLGVGYHATTAEVKDRATRIDVMPFRGNRVMYEHVLYELVRDAIQAPLPVHLHIVRMYNIKAHLFFNKMQRRYRAAMLKRSRTIRMFRPSMFSMSFFRSKRHSSIESQITTSRATASVVPSVRPSILHASIIDAEPQNASHLALQKTRFAIHGSAVDLRHVPKRDYGGATTPTSMHNVEVLSRFKTVSGVVLPSAKFQQLQEQIEMDHRDMQAQADAAHTGLHG